MANTKSAIKNIRKNRARYQQNRAVISRLKTLEKKFHSAIDSKDLESSTLASRSFISALERPQNLLWYTQIKFLVKNLGPLTYWHP